MDIVKIADIMSQPAILTLIALLAISFLFTLYAITLMNKKLRLIHDELVQISDDNRLLNESVRFLQTKLTGNAPPAS